VDDAGVDGDDHDDYENTNSTVDDGNGAEDCCAEDMMEMAMMMMMMIKVNLMMIMVMMARNVMGPGWWW